MNEYNIEQYTTDNIQKIKDFSKKNKMEITPYDYKNESGEIHRLWLLEDIDGTGISNELAEKCLQAEKIVQSMGILNNCKYIAEKIVNTKYADGIIATQTEGRGSIDFTGWSNHWINFIVLDDKKIMTLDYTAGQNTDKDQGNFNILGLTATNLDELKIRLKELYGGEWTVVKKNNYPSAFKKNLKKNLYLFPYKIEKVLKKLGIAK